jgi:hypothetical protein
MNNLIYIPFTCGEYLLDNNKVTYLEHEDYPYEGYQLITGNPVQVLNQHIASFTTLINSRIQSKHAFGDDDFYDYIPDYIDQILALASYMDNHTFRDTQERISQIVTRYFNAHPVIPSEKTNWTGWLNISQYNIHQEILAYLREVEAID